MASPEQQQRRRGHRSPPESSSSGSGWKWAGAAVAVVGGVMLCRTLLRGTAPNAASNYRMYHAAQQQQQQTAQRVSDMPPNWRRAKPEYHPDHATMGAGGRHATPGSAEGIPGVGGRHHTYQEYTAHQSQQAAEQRAEHYRQQRQWEAEYDAAHSGRSGNTTPPRPKSDFAKYEAFQQAERDFYASQAAAAAEGRGTDSDFTPIHEHDRKFEFGKEQARADYVQSKFVHLKKARSVKRYESWAGGGSRDAEGDEEGAYDEDEHRSRLNDEDYQYKSLQRQLATQPRFVLARQLLFGDPTSVSAASLRDASAAPAASPFASRLPAGQTSMGPLSVSMVRQAFFSRAKQCHPDVPGGGNKEQFQRLTDAYDLLVDALEPMENTRRAQQQARAQRAQEAEAEQSAQSETR